MKHTCYSSLVCFSLHFATLKLCRPIYLFVSLIRLKVEVEEIMRFARRFLLCFPVLITRTSWHLMIKTICLYILFYSDGTSCWRWWRHVFMFFLSVAGDSGHPADMLWGQKKGMLPKKQWKRDALQGTMVNNLGFLVKYLQHNTSTFKSLSSWNTTRAIRESSNDTKYLLLKRWLAVGYRHVCSWPIISAWSGLQGGVGSFDLGKQDCHNKFRGPCDLRFRCHWGSDCQGKHWSHRVREEELGRRHVTHAGIFRLPLAWLSS